MQVDKTGFAHLFGALIFGALRVWRVIAVVVSNVSVMALHSRWITPTDLLTRLQCLSDGAALGRGGDAVQPRRLVRHERLRL